MTSDTTYKKIKVKIDDRFYKIGVSVTHDMNGIVTGMNPDISDVRNIANETGYAVADVIAKVTTEINEKYRIKA